MNNFKPYCPKCGAPLTTGANTLYYCSDYVNCYYTLDEENTIDIGYKGKGISKALSNLCPYPFVIDGIFCSSMESFIQSLKVQAPDVQEDICSKSNIFCYSLREMLDDWRTTQTLLTENEYISLLNSLRKGNNL